MRHALPLLRASFTMMLRSRGVIFAMVAIPVQVAALGLLGGLGFGVGGTRLDFIDFALPGMAAFSPIASLQDTTIAIAASYKTRGILRRLAATPVSPGLLVAAQAVSYVVLGVGVSAIALAVSAIMGAKIVVGLNLVWLIPLMAMGVLTALSISFTIAGLTSNPATANIVGGSLALPLFVLTGAILPVAALPTPLPEIVPYALPFTALIEAIRGIVLTGASITSYGSQMAVGTAWLVAMFLIASRAYRFTEALV